MNDSSREKIDNVIAQLRPLPLDVLHEISTETVAKLQSQFTAHLSTEQRGFTLAGFTLAAASTATGAYLSAVTSHSNLNGFQGLYLSFIGGMLSSAILALISAWPKTFHMPGSAASNWYLSTWPKGCKRDLKSAKLEQLAIHQVQIEWNAQRAKRKAMLQIASLIAGLCTIPICGFQALQGG